MEAFGGLANATNRGPLWHKQLEAAFAAFKPLLAQAEECVATFAIGKAEVPGAGPAAPAISDKASDSGRPASAASKGSSKGSGKGDKKKKKDDEPEGPDEGRAALYNGMASYIRCIEMLRDPAQVRKDERLRAGGVGALPDLTDGAKAPDGLTQKVGRIKSALALDVALTLPDTIKQANLAMGVEPDGSLPDQTERLIKALGLQ